jgi:hypothetical protein
MFDALNQSLYLLVNNHSRGKRANSRHSNEIVWADAIGDLASTWERNDAHDQGVIETTGPLGRRANEHSPHQSWIWGSTKAMEQAGIKSWRRPERAALGEDHALRRRSGSAIHKR